jgi:hypothetical protein
MGDKKHYTYQPMRITVGVPGWKTEVRVGDEPVYATRLEIVCDARTNYLEPVVRLEVPLFGDGEHGEGVDVIEGMLIPQEDYAAFQEWQRAKRRLDTAIAKGVG